MLDYFLRWKRPFMLWWQMAWGLRLYGTASYRDLWVRQGSNGKDIKTYWLLWITIMGIPIILLHRYADHYRFHQHPPLLLQVPHGEHGYTAIKSPPKKSIDRLIDWNVCFAYVKNKIQQTNRQESIKQQKLKIYMFILN